MPRRNIDHVFGFDASTASETRSGGFNEAAEAWRSRRPASAQRTLSLHNTGGVKSIRARPELWGCCVTARIRSLSLAEPQPNGTAEPQYVLLDPPPSLSLSLPLSLSPAPPIVLLINCHTGLSNTIRDEQADCPARPSETRRCCGKSEVELQGSQTAAHFTAQHATHLSLLSSIVTHWSSLRSC